MKPVNSYIGTAVARLEDPRFLTGRGEYVGDLFPAGLLHAVILRSPVAHGRIVVIDTAAARAMQGVHAVFTAADIGETAYPWSSSWFATAAMIAARSLPAARSLSA